MEHSIFLSYKFSSFLGSSNTFPSSIYSSRMLEFLFSNWRPFFISFSCSTGVFSLFCVDSYSNLLFLLFTCFYSASFFIFIVAFDAADVNACFFVTSGLNSSTAGFKSECCAIWPQSKT